MTEEEIKIRVICAVIAGRCGSYYHSAHQAEGYVYEAFKAADEVIRQWKRRKEKENQTNDESR